MLVVSFSFQLRAIQLDTLGNPIITEIDTTICYGAWFEIYSEPGIYIDTFIINPTCDSIRILNLSFHEQNEATTAYTCDSEDQGIYYVIHIDQNGCDSLVIHEPFPEPSENLVQTYTFCEGEIFVTDEGLEIDSSGSYEVVISEVGPCQSTLTYIVTFLPLGPPVSDTICTNEDYTPGTYDLTGPGCSEGLTLVVLPIVDEEYSSVEFCLGDTIQWNNQLLTESGIYENVETSTDGCTTDKIELTELPAADCVSSLDKLEASSQFYLYPNPVSSTLHLKSNLSDNRQKEIRIFDALGQLVSTTVTEQNGVQVSTDDLLTGSYSIRVKLEGGKTQILRFIKQ